MPEYQLGHFDIGYEHELLTLKRRRIVPANKAHIILASALIILGPTLTVINVFAGLMTIVLMGTTLMFLTLIQGARLSSKGLVIEPVTDLIIDKRQTSGYRTAAIKSKLLINKKEYDVETIQYIAVTEIRQGKGATNFCTYIVWKDRLARIDTDLHKDDMLELAQLLCKWLDIPKENIRSFVEVPYIGSVVVAVLVLLLESGGICFGSAYPFISSNGDPSFFLTLFSCIGLVAIDALCLLIFSVTFGKPQRKSLKQNFNLDI